MVVATSLTNKLNFKEDNIMKKNIMVFALGVAAGALIVGFDKVKNAVVEGYNQAKDKINEARQKAEAGDPAPEPAPDAPADKTDEETK